MIATAIDIVTTAVEGALRLIDPLGPWWVLAISIVVCAGLFLIVLRLASNPARIARARDQLLAAVYEVRLFMDAPAQLLRAQGRVVKAAAVYLAWLAPPVIILGPPMVALVAHLELRMAVDDLAVGEPALLAIETAEPIDASQVSLQSGDASGLQVTAPPLFVKQENTLYVRAQPTRPGAFDLTVTYGMDALVKRFVVGSSGAIPSSERHRGLAALWAIGNEPALRGPIFVSAGISHPTKHLFLSGIVPWWVLWLLGTMALTLAARKPFHVEI